MQDYRKLIVWQKSHALTLEIYRVTQTFPKSELYGLVSQIRRAASSIPANIAEGCGREGSKELKRFLSIAYGSASELDYHLLLAKDLNFLGEEEHKHLEKLLSEVRRILNTFIKKLMTHNSKPLHKEKL
jgi:four helix bundle protein